MAPVILQTDVHCLGCARKIRRVIKNMYGVENVWASPDTGLVVVAGWADASALQSRIQYRIRRPVAIVSDGSEEVPPPQQLQGCYPPYGAGVVHPGQRHYAGLPPPPPPQPAYYQYDRRFVPPGAEPSVCFRDERPNGCCVQ